MTIYELFLDFLAEKSVYCSDDTISYYSGNVMRFLLYLGDYQNIKLDSVSKEMVNNYVYALRDKGIKNVSVNTYVRAIRIFFNWCHDHGYMTDNFMQELKFLKSDKKNIVPLYEDEAGCIDSCFDLSTELGLRNYCIFHLMLDCGLRLGEVVRYSAGSFYQGQNIITVLGKGNKYRLVPVPGWLKEKLMLYHSFGNDRFRKLDSCNVSTGTIKQMFAKLKKVSGIERLYPHLLRHTFATSYMLGGGNLEYLRLLMGHSDYEVTKNYLHLASQFQLLGADIYKLDAIFFKSGYEL